MHFEIPFSGHRNIRALHEKTIEITTESNLTPSGDCIIGVNAKSGCNGIPKKIKEKLRNSKTKITFSILVNEKSFTVQGNGHPDLSLTNLHDIVLRKSSFVCPRTLAINCDKACDSIPRTIIKDLQDPKTSGVFRINLS